MRSMTVLSALYNATSGRAEVIKEIVNDDLTVDFAGQTFDPEAVEWTAAVYDTDINEAIDFILYEPHVENLSPLEMETVAARTAHRTRVVNFKQNFSRPTPYTRQQARAVLLASAVDNRYAAAAIEDPLDVLRRECPIDSEALAQKKAFIENARRTRSQAPSQVAHRMDAKERIAELSRRQSTSNVNTEIVEPRPVVPKGKLKPIELVRGKRVT